MFFLAAGITAAIVRLLGASPSRYEEAFRNRAQRSRAKSETSLDGEHGCGTDAAGEGGAESLPRGWPGAVGARAASAQGRAVTQAAGGAGCASRRFPREGGRGAAKEKCRRRAPPIT